MELWERFSESRSDEDLAHLVHDYQTFLQLTISRIYQFRHCPDARAARSAASKALEKTIRKHHSAFGINFEPDFRRAAQNAIRYVLRNLESELLGEAA
jgi:hypothetical protein